MPRSLACLCLIGISALAAAQGQERHKYSFSKEMPGLGVPEGAVGSDRMRMTLSGQVCGDPSRDIWTVQSTYEFRGSRYIPGRMPQRTIQQPPFRMVCQTGSDKDRALRAQYPPYQVGSCEFTAGSAPSIKVHRPMFDQPGIKEHEAYALVTTVNDEGPCQTVKAVARAPASIGRAAVVALDASESKGPIRRYVWSFKPGEGCPAELEPFSLEGPKQSFQVLCPLRGTLTVVSSEDESDTDSQDFQVQVTPRKWKTAFVSAAQASYDAPFDVLYKRFGKNVCAENDAADQKTDGGTKDADDDSAPNHWIHRKSDARDSSGAYAWEKTGYEVAQVAEGPFGGFWYVSESRLKVHRQPYVNSRLLPGGEVYALNAGKPYREDMDLLARQVREHERVHGELAQRYLLDHPEKDPAPQIEPMAFKDKEWLILQVDGAVGNADSLLGEASAEPNVRAELHNNPRYKGMFDRGGKILVPRAGDEPFEFHIDHYWDLGDDYGSSKD